MRNVFWFVLVVLGAVLLVISIAIRSQRFPESQQTQLSGCARNPTRPFLPPPPLDGKGKQIPPAALSESTGIFESLLPSINRANTGFPEVFKDCDKILQFVRNELQSPRHPPWRPGELRGKINMFARSAPESRFVTERVGTCTNSIIWRGKYEQVLSFTDDEVKAGRQRNAAARMAILDHLLNASNDDPPYMQRELVDIIWEWWWKAGKYQEEDNIIGENILHALAMNPARPPAMRFAASTRPPLLERQDILNAIMVAVLEDDRISDPSMDVRDVSDAVRLLMEHGGEEGQRLLSDTSSSVTWKQTLINQALGLPPPPFPKEKEAPPEEELEIDVVL